MVEIVVVIICLFLNAILSLVEMAFVTVGRPELRQLAKKNNLAAVRLSRLRENPERTLSVLQIGITIVGAVSAAVGGAGAKESFVPYLVQNYSLSETQADALSIFLVVVPLTYFSVVLGELVPKTIALRFPLKIALSSSRWLVMGETLLSPFVHGLEISTQFFVRILFPKWKRTVVSSDESDSVNISNLSGDHREFVINLVHIENQRIRDILVPWSEVDHVTTDTSLNEVLSMIIKSGHTRLPVIENDQIVGLLHSKEFITFVSSGDENWRHIIRPLLQIRPQSAVLKTLRLMQEKKSHMAVVVEMGQLLGVVTLEDIMEEIVGDISDEDDDGRIRKLMSSRPWQKTTKKAP